MWSPGSGYITMRSDSTPLERAMSLVDQERSYLREERRAYEAFQERVRLATADPTDATAPRRPPRDSWPRTARR